MRLVFAVVVGMRVLLRVADLRAGAGEWESALDKAGVALKHGRMASVVVEKLCKVFKGPQGEIIRALTEASFTVAEGEFLVLVGPSGCGKSTTLRLIAGLEEVTSGGISIDGRLMNEVPAKERDIAMVFQNHALYPHMTVRENLAFGLKLRGKGRAEIAERVARAAGILGLRDCLERRPRELSGGQRQRVAVGRAMVREPKLFLFDEPLSNLDAQMRVQMRREISKLHRQLRATMIYVTHDQVEALTMGDRVAVMKEGVIQQIAVPSVLYNEPANLFVAGFIGSPAMNFFRGALVKEGGAVFFAEEVGSAEKGVPGFKVRVEDSMAAGLGAYVGKKIVVGMRPEHVLDAGAGRGDLAGGTVEVLIEAVEPLGAETFVYASSGGHSIVARWQNAREVKGKTTLAFEMGRAHFFDEATGGAVA